MNPDDIDLDDYGERRYVIVGESGEPVRVWDGNALTPATFNSVRSAKRAAKDMDDYAIVEVTLDCKRWTITHTSNDPHTED